MFACLNQHIIITSPTIRHAYCGGNLLMTLLQIFVGAKMISMSIWNNPLHKNHVATAANATYKIYIFGIFVGTIRPHEGFLKLKQLAIEGGKNGHYIKRPGNFSTGSLKP